MRDFVFDLQRFWETTEDGDLDGAVLSVEIKGGTAKIKIDTTEATSEEGTMYAINLSDPDNPITQALAGVHAVSFENVESPLNITLNKNITKATGGSNDDYMRASDAGAVLDGGEGNDVLSGGAGADTYAYNANGGHDRIKNFHSNDKIRFGGRLWALFQSMWNNILGLNSSNDGEDEAYILRDENGNLVVILGGDSSITIENGGESVTFTNEDGDELVWSADEADDYDDYYDDADDEELYNDADSVKVNGTSGDDWIENWGSYVTIDAGAGNDYIENEGNDVSINGGAGNDYIDNNYYDYLTISGGTGNDTINGYGDDILFKYAKGDGNDIIYGFNATSTLSISGGTYSTAKSGSNLIVTVGDGKISLVNAANLSTVNIKGSLSGGSSTNSKLITGTSGADSINNSISGATINALGGNDSISNIVDKVSISGGAGADVIVNDGSYSTINGDNGNDNIYNYVLYVSINGGAGDDDITNSYGDFTTINGGAGDDYIDNYEGSNVTISGGAGADFIQNSGSNILFKYASGDGDDYIEGFNATSTLSISGGKYSTTKNGKNIIVTVGDGKISLIGAASLSAVNIKGTSAETNTWKLSGTTATYGTTSNTLFTLKGVKSLSGLSLSNKVVTVSNASLNQKAVTISEGYTLKLGSDVAKSSTAAATWSLSNSTATYKSAKTTAGYKLADNKISYVTASGGSTLATVSGVKSLSGLSLSGKVVTVSNASLNQKAVTISDGYTLKLGSNVTQSKTTAASWTLNNSTATYKSAKTTAGYKLASNKISYVTASGGNTLATVSGVKSLSGLSLSGKIVTVSNASLNKSNVTISEGYTLKLGSDVAKSSTTAANWTLSNSTATYKSAKTTAGYKLASNKISYVTASGGNTLATVSGVKSLSGLSLSGTTVTVSNASLNKKAVTISDGYTLKLGSNVTQSKTTAAKWTLNNSTATYKSGKRTAGYTLSDNKISYVKASGGSTLATVSGVKSLSGLSLSGKIVTVSNASLNKSNVTISEGYTLKLGSDVTKSTSTAANWTLNNSTATYKSAKTSAGYKLSDNKISYVTASGGNTLATVSGVKSLSGLSLSGKVVTVSNASLNQKAVTISDGYTLKLGSNVTQSKTTAAKWTLSNSTATYKSAKTSAGYKLSDNKISYVTAGGGSTLATVKGVKSKPTVSDKIITLTTSNISKAKKVTVSGGGYEFDFAAGNYKKTSISGTANADTIKIFGTSTTVSGGKGNDSLISNSNGGNVFVYNSGDGDDVITNFAATDKLSIKSAATYSVSGSDVIFSVGNGSITLKDAKDKTFTYYVDGTEKIYSNVTLKPYTISGKGVTLSSSYDKPKFSVSTVSGGSKIVTIDASAVTHELEVKGNSKANKIIASDAGSTLDAGSGKVSDTLIGGAGADVFVYYSGDGKDVISGYDSNDTIKIAEGTVSSITTSRENVIFKVGSGKITIQDAKETRITYIENGIEYGCVDGKKTFAIKTNNNKVVATLAKNYWKDSFDVTTFGNEEVGSSIQRIDASKVTHTLTITGNDSANEIIAGKGDETLIGGKGDDSIYGDDGKKIYVYTNGDGDDRIYNYGDSDKVSIKTSGSVKVTTSGDDVLFTVGKGKITLVDAAAKSINYVVNGSSKTTLFSGDDVDNAWFLDDEDNYIGADNQLSSIVRDGKASYSLLQTENSLSLTAKNDSLPALTYSAKK